jgi:ABC-type glycerol-3-phosphate transport system substrate-binding protein
MSRLLLLWLVLLLTACSTASPAAPIPSVAPTSAPAVAPPTAPAGPITITFGSYEYNRPIYEPLVREFNAANADMQVQLVSIDNLMSGSTPNSTSWERRLASSADSFAAWGGAMIAPEQGVFYDLAPLMAADASFDQADFYPNAIQTDSNGRVTMLPTSLRLPLLMYNRDLWDERGVPRPTADWTWADLRAAATQLASRNGDEIETYGLMLANRADLVTTSDLHSLGPLLVAADSGSVDLTSPPYVAALEEMATLVRDGAVFTPPEYPDGSYLYSDDYLPLIKEGRLGMWRSEHYQVMNGQEPPFDRGLVPMPATDTSFWGVLREGLAISAGTAYPEQAWRWIAFLSTKSLLQPGLQGAETIHARRSLAEASKTWAALDDEGRATVTAALAQLERERPALTAQQNARAWSIRNAISSALAAVLDKDEDPAAALAIAQATLDEEAAAAAAATATPEANPAPIVVATAAPAVVAAPDATRINFITTDWGNEGLRAMAQEFNQQFPEYFVEVRQFEWPQDGSTVGLNDLAATADCFQGWAPPGQKEDRDALLDLRPLLDADASFPQDDLPIGLRTLFEQDGKLVGLPHAVTFRTLQYNQDLFDAAGVPYPTPAWTLDDLIATAEQLNTARDDEGSYGFIPQGGWDLFVFLALTGVPMMQGEGPTAQPDFANPAVTAAIERYFALLRAASPATGLPGYERDQSGDDGYQLIEAGRAAVWFSYGMNNNHNANVANFRRGLTALPLENGAASAEFFSTGLFISAATADPAPCWAWIRYLLDSPSSVNDGFPARVSVAESPRYLADAPEGAAELYAAVKPALLATQPPGGMAAVYRAEIDTYWLLRAADRAFQGGNLEQELEDAQFLTEQHLACVRSGESAGSCAKQVDPTYNGWAQE